MTATDRRRCRRSRVDADGHPNRLAAVQGNAPVVATTWDSTKPPEIDPDPRPTLVTPSTISL